MIQGVRMIQGAESFFDRAEWFLIYWTNAELHEHGVSCFVRSSYWVRHPTSGAYRNASPHLATAPPSDGHFSVLKAKLRERAVYMRGHSISARRAFDHMPSYLSLGPLGGTGVVGFGGDEANHGQTRKTGI
jgi:hypothetical protein